MKIIPLTLADHVVWNKFCLESDDAWFWHTPHYHEFILNYRPEANTQSHAFAISNGNEMLAVCPLTIEATSAGGERVIELTYGGHANQTPALANHLTGKRREKVLRYAFDYIDEVAAEVGAVRSYFRLSPLSPSCMRVGLPQSNFLHRYGYLDGSLDTQIIDLRESEEQLWKDLSENHRRNIKTASVSLSTKIYSGKNCHSELFDHYQNMHHLAAGRATRPQRTFDLMYDWIQDGLEVLVAVELADKVVGFVLILIYKNCAYFHSSCVHPEHSQYPIGHCAHWTAMRWLKSQNVRFYEIGWQHFGPTMHHRASEKEINISRFKRSFGGITVPFWMGEKFYSADFFRTTMQQRTEQFGTYLKEQIKTRRDWDDRRTGAGQDELDEIAGQGARRSLRQADALASA